MDSQPVVLLVTNDQDVSVDPVVRELRDRDASLVRFDIADFPGRLKVLADSKKGETALGIRGRVQPLDQVTAVWFGRPGFVRISTQLPEAERASAAQDSYDLLAGVLQAVDCLWVNRPSADLVAGFKVLQLKIAREVGLAVPRTLVSNSPDEVRRLRSEEDLVYKLLGGPLHTASGVPATMLTAKIGSVSDCDLERIRFTPCLVQEYIDKVFDLRLTVIGRSWFPVRIDARGDEMTQVDWRRKANRPNFGESVAVPSSVLDGVLALMDRLNLVYGALDFAVDRDGVWHFLEINPMGQFMWIAELLDLPMASAMADLLVAGVDALDEPVQVVRY